MKRQDGLDGDAGWWASWAEVLVGEPFDNGRDDNLIELDVETADEYRFTLCDYPEHGVSPLTDAIKRRGHVVHAWNLFLRNDKPTEPNPVVIILRETPPNARW